MLSLQDHVLDDLTALCCLDLSRNEGSCLDCVGIDVRSWKSLRYGRTAVYNVAQVEHVSS